MNPTPLKIALVGTGNVAYHLAKRLHEVNCSPSVIISREQSRAEKLIGDLALSSRPTTNWEISSDLDYILLAVPDQAIAEVLVKISSRVEATVLHMSGSQPISALSSFFKYGVLYPFQTFTRVAKVSFETVPILIEGSDQSVTAGIEELAKMLSTDVREVSSENRLKVHLAAVFANNFSNHLYQISSEILKGTGFSFPDFQHLLEETVDKAISLTPSAAQTGPAQRGDVQVMKRHLDMLEKINPKYSSIYKLISDLITQKIK